MIAIIAAVARNGVIGNNGSIPWHLPEDLRHFKALTMGKVVIMGRKTFESIMQKLGRPLPGRTNVVITRNKDYEVPSGVKVCHSLDDAVAAYPNDDLWIIGGGEIYRQALDRADTLHITHVEGDYDGDALFPDINPAIWHKTREEPHQGFVFTTYERV